MSVRDILLAAGRIVGWNLAAAAPIPSPWVFSTARFYTGNLVSVASQENVPQGVAFSSDGTKMYVLGTQNDTIYQYTLSTPWLVNTASYDSVSFSVAALELTPNSLFFRPTGDKLWVVGSTEDSIFEITLSTPWDLSTATFSVTPFMGNLIFTGVNSSALTDYDTTPSGIVFHPDGDKLFYVGSANDIAWAFSLSPAYDLSSIAPIETTWHVAGLFYSGNSFSAAAQEDVSTGLWFKPDGTEAYIVGWTNDTVFQYTLSTAWDLSTASYSAKSFSVASQSIQPYGISFKDDGTTFFMVGSAAVFEYTIATPWDISTASYTGNSFSTSAQETTPLGVFFKPDGTKMYVIGSAGDDVNEYNLSTAWNITTASYIQNFSVSAQDTLPAKVVFTDDGLTMFVLGYNTRIIYQYALTVAWDISTATYQGIRSRSLASQETLPLGIYFKPDGKVVYINGDAQNTIFEYKLYEAAYVGGQDNTPGDIEFKSDGSKMYMVGSSNDKVFEYDLSVNWDLSTALYANKEFSLTPYELTPTGMAFSNDGDYLFITGNTALGVTRYSLSTPWDITSASINFGPYNWKSRADVGTFSVASQETVPNAIAFKPDGTKMYVMGSTGDDVNEYDLSTPWIVTTSSFVRVSSALTQDTVPTGLAFSSDGSKMFMCGSGTDVVYQYSLSTPWDVSTLSYTNVSFSLASQDNVPGNIWFSSDGLRMFMVGTQRDYVWQYDLSVAWDLSTISFSLSPWNVRGNIYSNKSFSVTSQEATPTGMFFSSSGDKAFVIGTTNDTVYQYALATPWDISTASYTSVSFAFTWEATPQTVVFKTDGTRMYIMGSTRDIMYSFDLSSGWDLSTATFTPNPWSISTPFSQGSFSVTSQEATPTGLIFGDSGTKMYIVGTTNDTVYQYDLSTAWNVSTASYASKSFSVATQENVPQAVFFKTDGASMYILGTQNDTVYQYTLSTPWDVSTASYATKSFSVAGQETVPTGLYISPDGLNMYVIGSNTDTIYQYVLGTAWDISTASYTSYSLNRPATLGETVPTGVFFKDDGTFIYFIGSTLDVITGYPVGTPWSLRTVNTGAGVTFTPGVDGTPQKIIFSDSGENFYVLGGTNDTVYQFAACDGFNVAGQETVPTDVAFSSDGSLMYVIGQTNDTVFQYALATPWQVSTAVYTSISLAFATEATPTSLNFKSDGSILYILGTGTDIVYQLQLEVPWQVNTYLGRQISSISVATQDATPNKIRFNLDADNFFILGGTNDTIYQYNLVKTLNANLTTGSAMTLPTGLAVSADGKYVFVGGVVASASSAAIHQFELSTPWDITTVTNFSGANLNTVISPVLDLGAIVLSGLTLSADGYYLYMVESTGDLVRQYAMLAGIRSPTTNNAGLAFSSDGKRVTFLSSSTDRTYGYELDVAWDLTSASKVAQSPGFTTTENVPSAVTYKTDGSLGYVIGTLDIIRTALPVTTFFPVVTLNTVTAYAPKETTPTDAIWNDDGTKLYFIGSSTDFIDQYTVSTPWNETTAVFEKSFFVGGQETAPQGMMFNNNGYELYVIGSTTDRIFQYNLSVAWDVGTAVYSGISLLISGQDGNPTGIAFATTGKDLYMVGSTSDNVNQYNLYSSFSVLPQTGTPSDVSLKPDGTKMYVASTAADRRIYQYSLSTPWSVHTAVYDNKASGYLASVLNGFYIKPDGTTLFGIGTGTDRVEEYIMSVPWDISTLVFTEKTFSVASQEINPNSVFFKPDGTAFYIVGTTNDTVYQYTVSSPWNISTASYASKSFSVASQELTPTSLYFKPDGTRMYVIGSTTDSIFEYALSTPWDVSTATYTSISFSISPYELTPTGLDFSDDGLNMYILGSTSDTVYQFNIGA
jgi:sugar lactone lactonase YvrE